MCTYATRNKIKGLKEFTVLDRARECHDLIKVTKSIMLQFKSHKDLVTAPTRCLKCIMDYKQGPDICLIKHEQKFLALLSTYKAYGGSLGLPVIIKRDITKDGYTETSPPSAEQANALHEKSNTEV